MATHCQHCHGPLTNEERENLVHGEIAFCSGCYDVDHTCRMCARAEIVAEVHAIRVCDRCLDALREGGAAPLETPPFVPIDEMPAANDTVWPDDAPTLSRYELSLAVIAKCKNLGISPVSGFEIARLVERMVCAS